MSGNVEGVGKNLLTNLIQTEDLTNGGLQAPVTDNSNFQKALLNAGTVENELVDTDFDGTDDADGKLTYNARADLELTSGGAQSVDVKTSLDEIKAFDGANLSMDDLNKLTEIKKGLGVEILDGSSSNISVNSETGAIVETVTRPDGKTEIIEYTTDANGNLITKHKLGWTNSDKPQTEYTCTYKDGKMESKAGTWYNADGSSQCEYEFTFNNNVNPKTATLLKWGGSAYDNSTKENAHKYDVIYNEDGTQKERTESVYDSDNKLIAKGYYDDIGRQTGNVVYNKENGKVLTEENYDIKTNELTSKVEYLYDKNGNKKGTYEYTYEFDENGKRAKEVKYEYDNSGKKISLVVSNYDEKGRVPKTVVTYYDENDNVKSSYELNHTYNDNGKPIETLIIMYDDKGNAVSKATREYNENGKRIKETCDYFDAEQNKMGSSIYEYNYDANGNQTKVVQTKYDANGNETGSEATYYNYQNGKLKGAWIYNYDKDGKMTGKTLVEYDENGDISKITKYDENGKEIPSVTV